MKVSFAGSGRTKRRLGDVEPGEAFVLMSQPQVLWMKIASTEPITGGWSVVCLATGWWSNSFGADEMVIPVPEAEVVVP